MSSPINRQADATVVVRIACCCSVGLTALLSLCFGVAVSVEEVREVPPETADRVTSLVADEIERTTGVGPVLDYRLWSSCDEGARCLEEVRQRTGESEILLLRIFGGPLSIQLVAEKVVAGGVSEVPRTVDLPKSEPLRWQSLVAEMVATLFTERKQAAHIVDRPIEPVPTSLIPDWIDWVVLGTAVAAGGVATGFAISSARAKSAAEENFVGGDEYDRHAGRYRDHRNVAIATGVAGGVLAGGWIALIVFD